MKKILCLTLCIVFAFSLIACGEEKPEIVKHSVDIEYYAKLGQITDFKYELGDDVEETKALLEETLSDDGVQIYSERTWEDYTVMTDGGAYCCYKTDDKDGGLTHVVKCGDAYGFTVGKTVSSEVLTAMKSFGFNASEREVADGELFFIPTDSSTTVLKYKFDKNAVIFVFQEHTLAATVILK